MEVDYAILADSAEAVNGKLYLMGGSFDTLWAANFPMKYPKLSFAMRILFSPVEMERQHALEVSLINADGKPLTTVRGPLNLGAKNPELPSGWKQGFLTVLNFGNLEFASPGHYSFEITVNNENKKSVPLRVAQTADIQTT